MYVIFLHKTHQYFFKLTETITFNMATNETPTFQLKEQIIFLMETSMFVYSSITTMPTKKKTFPEGLS